MALYPSDNSPAWLTIVSTFHLFKLDFKAGSQGAEGLIYSSALSFIPLQRLFSARNVSIGVGVVYRACGQMSEAKAVIRFVYFCPCVVRTTVYMQACTHVCHR